MSKIRIWRVGALCGLLALAAALSGCAGTFSSSDGNASDVYYAEFTDVPIPSAMEQHNGASQVTKAANGSVNGYLEFSGSVSWDSLVNACASNLTRDGWSVNGLFRGEHSVIVADKMDRSCVITIDDGFPSTTMNVWVTDKINGFIAPLAAPGDSGSGGGSGDTYTTTTGTSSSGGSSSSSSSGGGGLKEQGLSN